MHLRNLRSRSATPISGAALPYIAVIFRGRRAAH